MLSPPYSHAAQKDRAQLVAGTPMAPTPEGASLGGKGACDILRSLHLALAVRVAMHRRTGVQLRKCRTETRSMR